MEHASSVWERLFCTSQCPHCTVADLDAQQEQMSESNYDDETMPGVDMENLPPMNYFAVEGSPGKLTGSESIPWAALGSSGPSRKETLLPRRGPEMGFDFGGVPAVPSQLKKPCASVNPLSRFGFITATFSADRYLPDPQDPIDVEMAKTLLCLDRGAAASLTLRRLMPGKYEIDGTRVSVRWSPEGLPGLVVREDVAGNPAVGPDLGGIPTSSDVPLLDYLRQAASILERICRPDPRTLTFPDAVADDRFQSMEIACKQAQLREQAAEAEASRRNSFANALGPLVLSPLMPRAATLPLKL